MTDFSTWFHSVPVFTRYWLAGTVALSLIGRIGLIDMSYLILDSAMVFKKFQIWRLVTAVLFYPITPQTGFHFMLNCYFLYQYSNRLETDQFKTSPGDYFFLLLLNWLACALIGLVSNFMLLMDPMVLSVLYIWCKLNSDAIVNFWFGTRFKAMYLPWVLLGVNLLLGSTGMYSIVGILVGHGYYFLKFVYPQELNGPSLIETPNIIKNYFPDIRGGVHSFTGAPINQGRPAGGDNAAAGGGLRNRNPFSPVSSWGQGQRLGRE